MYILEKTLSLRISGPVKEVLRNTPVVSRKKLIELARPCDILVVLTPKPILDSSRFLRIRAIIMKTIQGTPYVSSKLVIHKDRVMGYGANPKTVNTFDSYPLTKYVKTLREACLIRIPNLSTEQKKRTLSFLLRRKGLTYDSKGTFKSAWDRLFTRKLKPFYKDDPTTKSTVDSIKEALFCSNIISIGFIYAGVKIRFSENPYDVWPQDFLLHPKTEKIGRFEY